MNHLPATFATARAGLHRLACFVIAPARKARTGRIGLRATGDGFGTPAFDDGSRIAVRGAELLVGGRSAPITTLREMAAFTGVELSADPGVGDDLPPYEPDAGLGVDAAGSLALGAWFALGATVLGRIEVDGGTVSGAQLWPEHFDLAVVVMAADGSGVNVGFSPGDSFSAEPYVYVGPHDLGRIEPGFCNAPFGAVRTYTELADARDAGAAADDFIAESLRRVAAAR